MQAVGAGGHRTGKEEEVGNLRVSKVEGEEEEEGVVAPLLLHLLCWGQMERGAEGHPRCDAGLMAAGEVACWRKAGSLRAAPLEEVQSGTVAEEEAHRLGPLKEEEVDGNLHGMEAAGGAGRCVGSGPGWEAGGPSDSVGVEGSERRDWSPAQEAVARAYRVEEAGVRQL